MSQDIIILNIQKTDLEHKSSLLSDKIRRLNEDVETLKREIINYTDEFKRVQSEYEKVCYNLDTIETDLLIKKGI